MSLKRNQREDYTAEEWLKKDEISLESHVKNNEYDWAVEIANNIAQIAFKEGKRDKAEDFIDVVYRPLIQRFHNNVTWEDTPGPGKEPFNDRDSFEDVNIPYEKWKKETKNWTEENHGQHVSPKSERVTQMRENLEKFKDTKDINIDIVSGPLTGGMGPALALEDIYEGAKLDLPEYSPYRNEDDGVEGYIASANIEAENILIVDDFVETGRTMEEMINYYQENGAGEVYVSGAMVHSRFDKGMEDGEIYRAEEIF